MIDTGTLRPSLPEFTSQIIDREEVRRMIDARDQCIAVQAECIAKQSECIARQDECIASQSLCIVKQRDVAMQLYHAVVAMRRTMYSDKSEESVMADAALMAVDKWNKESMDRIVKEAWDESEK
jgi:hypothetical protein